MEAEDRKANVEGYKFSFQKVFQDLQCEDYN